MKQCKTCFEVKSFTEFYTNGKQPSGKQKFHASCIVCEENDRKAFVEEKRCKLIELFGDKCTVCGYNRCYAALEFHHVDPSVKEYSPSKLLNNYSTLDKLLKEVEKCVLLCSNCHREVHAGVIRI